MLYIAIAIHLEIEEEIIYFYLNFKKTENKDNHDFGYFTITKRKSEHTHSNGDYIKIEFNLLTLKKMKEK